MDRDDLIESVVLDRLEQIDGPAAFRPYQAIEALAPLGEELLGPGRLLRLDNTYSGEADEQRASTRPRLLCLGPMQLRLLATCNGRHGIEVRGHVDDAHTCAIFCVLHDHFRQAVRLPFGQIV